MQLIIPFSELKEIIKNKSSRSLNFDLTTVNDNTVKVSYEAKVKVKIIGEVGKTFSLDVSVDKIEGEDLYLSYDGGFGVDMVVGGILMLVPQLKNIEFAEFSQNSSIILHLARIEDAHKALQQIDVHGVSFAEGKAIIEFTLK